MVSRDTYLINPWRECAVRVTVLIFPHVRMCAVISGRGKGRKNTSGPVTLARFSGHLPG